MTIARLLCPTDLSQASGHAAEVAMVVAGYYKAGITALHVVSPILTVPGFATPGQDELIEAIEMDRLRRAVATQFGAPGGHAIRVDVSIEMGQPSSRILERAVSLAADLIVMGTHGASGFEHLVLGSVTEKVLRKASCPVLTVPPAAQATSRLPFRHVLCAIDFSDSSLAALPLAVSLATESDAALTLLHVLEWPWQEPPPPVIEALPFEQGSALAEFRRYSEEGARKRLESLIPDSLSASQVTTRLRNGKPYSQILEIAAEEQTDLIVIGVHGRNPVDLALFGSTTNQVVRRATCPVLTWRR
jgi:nucleotide-binding universal stress UspA family protein